MNKLLAILILGLSLIGCSLVHRMDIEQGNVMTPDMLCRLHPGMTFGEVKEIMGSPMLLNTFCDNRIDYVYTFKKGSCRTTEKYVTLIFRGDRLREIRKFGC